MSKIHKYLLSLILLVVLTLTIFRWLILFALTAFSLPVLLLFQAVKANLHYLTFNIYSTKFPLIYMNPEFAERYKAMRFGFVLLADLLSLLLFLFILYKITIFYKIAPKRLARLFKKLKRIGSNFKKPKFLVSALVLSLVFWFFLILPLLRISLVAKSLIASPREITFHLKNKNFQAAEEKLKTVQEDLAVLKKNFNRLDWIGAVPLLKGYYHDVVSIIAAGNYAINSGLTIVEILPDLRPESLEEAERFIPQLEKILDNFSLAKNQIDKINPNRYPQKIKGKLIRENIILVQSWIEKLEEVRLAFQPIIKTLPEFIGGQRPKRFLVLFKENGELPRLTAYGVFRLEKGKVIPGGSGNLYQSNFNEASLRFYQNQGYDGILTIDGKFLVDLFSVLGPTIVYDQTLSSNLNPECNCPSIIVDIEKLPPARKKEIIGIFLNAALVKSLASSPKTQLEILFTILESAQEKHLLINFADPEIQKAVEVILK